MSPRMPAPISFLFPTPSFALSFAAHLSIYFWTCSPLFWLLCLLCLFMYYVLFCFCFAPPDQVGRPLLGQISSQKVDFFIKFPAMVLSAH
jgi:hypothetical protein